MPPQYFDAAVTAIYPFLFLDKLSRDVLAWLSHRAQLHPLDPDSAVMSESDYYEARRAAFIREWADRPAFYSLDMSDMDSEVHPRPRVRILWAQPAGRGVVAAAVADAGNGSRRAAQREARKPPPMSGFSNRFGLSFHQFGLAVPGPEEALRFLMALGYRRGPAVFDPLQSVYLALVTHAEMPAVEIVWPSYQPSPIDRPLRRGGPLVYLPPLLCGGGAKADE